MYKVQLGLVNGNLSIRDYRTKDSVDIWVMREYGVEESWSKFIVINDCTIARYIQVMVTGVGNVLLASYSSQTRMMTYNPTSQASSPQTRMMIYNPKSQASECEVEVLEDAYSKYLQIIAYTSSLVSLKDVAKGENVTDARVSDRLILRTWIWIIMVEYASLHFLLHRVIIQTK